MDYTSIKIKMFGFDWNIYNHTKWDDSRYDDAYFGISAMSIMDNKICLKIVKDPKHFEKTNIYPIDEGGIVKNLCCGEVNGPDMSYGVYEWTVRMPEYKNVWPALWLCGSNSWPPEIDIVEGYTENRGNYIKNIFTTKLKSNFHIREKLKNGTHINIGSKGIPTIIYKLYHKEYDTYKCIWTPSSIKIYFNDVLIRKMTDKKVLADFNESAKMYPIMNMMVDDGYVHDSKNPPAMLISNFSYIPLKN